MDSLAALRKRLAGRRSRPGLHPYWSSSPVMPDEPLWDVSFREAGQHKWTGGYRTAARDLEVAVAEARRYLRVAKNAEASARPIVPRSDSYRGAERMLLAMLRAVPVEHPKAGSMLTQLQSAIGAVAEAKEHGRYFGPLTLDLPVALEVDDRNAGRPQKVRMVTWMDHGGDWPEWNRCTVAGGP